MKDIGLIAGKYTVQQKLGEFYREINEASDSPDAVSTAFVARKSMGDTVHAFWGTLFLVGATIASGAIVATSAIMGGALMAAAVGAVAMGGIAGVLSMILHESDAEYLEEQVDEGHLVLFVRADSSAKEKQALVTLSNHGGFDAKVISAPAAEVSGA